MLRANVERLANGLLVTALVLCSACGGNSSTSPSDPKTPAADEKSLFIVGALQLDSQTCAAKAEGTMPTLVQGVMDLAFVSKYTLALLVGNQLLRANSSMETERISLRGAEVMLTTASGAVIDSYSVVGGGFIDSGTTSVAYGTLTIDVIPATVGQAGGVKSAQELVAKIKIFGEALNGTTMTSNELDFPIHVCTGCLVQYPPSAADTTIQAGSGYRCSANSVPGVDAPPPPCIAGQDATFSCVVCAATYSICRDPTQNPSY